MAYDKSQNNLNIPSCPEEELLRQEQDSVATRFGYSSLLACDDPLKRAQITQIARQNLGYVQ